METLIRNLLEISTHTEGWPLFLPLSVVGLGIVSGMAEITGNGMKSMLLVQLLGSYNS